MPGGDSSKNNEPVTLRISAERKNLATIRGFIHDHAQGLSSTGIDDLVLAVDEAATNIIVHGYEDQPGIIEITITRTAGGMKVTLRDWAPSYDPLQTPSPDISLPLHERKPGGLGVHLIRKCVDKVTYRRPAGGGNRLVLVKHYDTD